ncbi:hypothetical protein MBANPS3_002153 [Mucor bainieri]
MDGSGTTPPPLPPAIVRPNIGPRVDTEKEELDDSSKHIAGSEPQFYCNGIEVCARLLFPSHTLSSTAATSEPKRQEDPHQEREGQEDTNDKAFYHCRNSHVVVFSDKLSFATHQFALVLWMMMGILLYFGKFHANVDDKIELV